VLPPGTGTGAGRPLRPKRSLRAEITPAGEGALRDSVRMGARQRSALEALVAAPLGAAALARRTGCTHSTLRSLERRGLLRLESAAEAPRRTRVERVGSEARNVELTADQRAAFEAIERRIGGRGAPLLLHGVTGSGKTEVYLRAVAAALERGESAIVLVPEIALTPQTAGRFVERFGERVAVMHSRLSQRERYDEWWRMRRGEARVCVGPRSAVFAPFDDLGLIVVDEEHDGSYKQEGDPRYDARAVAERRAAEECALLVVGSATPRPESMLRYESIRLPARVDGRRLPPVELVGMTGTAGPLHERTREALDEVRRRDEKAIVLLNRRGWSNFLSCRSCARVWECPNCDVTLVLHRTLGEVSCHHCGHREVAPRACPDCGSASVARHGAGTEQLERELEELVAPLPVFRLDSDVAAAAGVATVLRRFDEAPAGVLVGTQMVAKGHDFPEVTLGVVLDADATLRFPDFRAEERTFALVAQLAGRSGRGERGGRVIVQALDPAAEALLFAARHDADGFLEVELRRRELLGYPPHGHLIRVVCSSTDPGPELDAAGAIRDLVAAAGVPALGPAPLFRRQARHRAQLVIRSADRTAAIGAVRAAVEQVAARREHASASFAVDVDPQ
jgi:primosomal protein N' (replication factor Y) (superfamily II helicase)